MTSLKCDYEKAWKEIEEKFGDEIVYSKDKRVGNTAGKLKLYMKEIEGRRRNIIDIRRRSNEEVAGFCMRKYMEMHAKYVDLKNKLEKLCQKSIKNKEEINEFKLELDRICRSIKGE
ncbi:hypothetical protein ES708_21398 [subsurface metagenome]